jgi:hypothetical protein
MQCANCEFQNIPGADFCGRCGSTLRVATAVLDVHPPRAGPWAKRLRRVLPLHRVTTQARDVSLEVRDRVTAGAAAFRLPVPTWPVLWRLIVPGWAHLYHGQRLRGRVFLAAYLFLLVFGLVCWGTGFGSILLGLAFSAHASACIDILFQCRGEFPSRLLTSVVVMAALSLALYVPGVWLLTRVADPRTIQLDAPPFAYHDVVLTNRWSRPKPGDVVLVHVRSRTITAGRAPAMVIGEGEMIDRVLAGPGGHVLWENGQLWVDGAVYPWSPLNPARLPARWEVKLPMDRYLISASTFPYINQFSPPDIWTSLSCVAPADIQGVVYVRHQPISRFWIIR